MGDAPLMLGVSGLRGIVGESLTDDVAERYAAAFAGWLREIRGAEEPVVVIGRDGRRGGETVQAAAVRGLVGAGCEVVDLGVAMTPTVGVMVDAEGADAGVVVTASHNPQEWNGLKCIVGGKSGSGASASAPSKEEADAIIGRFTSAELGSAGGGSLRLGAEPTGTHVDGVIGAIERLSGELSSGASVAVDSVHASGALGASMLLEALGVGEFLALGADGTGLFDTPPEPTAENLAVAGGLLDAVRESGCDVGFAQDPDADRLAVVGPGGVYIGEEYTLALCAESVLSAMDDPKGAVLAANLSTSRMIDDVAARYGARVVRTAVGEANVVEAMKRLAAEGERVALGGEGNGGVIRPEVTYVRDSLGSMALLLSLMSRSGKSIEELVAGIPSYAIEKRKTPIASKADAEPAVEAVKKAFGGARQDTSDGVRVDWDEIPAGIAAGGGFGWVHVRASNTEPIMRLIAEAPTVEAARGILAATEAAIAGG